MTGPAVFLDKDGTLVEDVPYNVEPSLIRLTPGAGEGLRLLRAAGYRLIVVSNQSGVARGFFAESALAAVECRLQELLAAFDVAITGFYWCPHHPLGAVPAYAVACECRKPRPGLIVRAACECDVDLGRSWMVGDLLDDVQAGRAAGCRTVLITHGPLAEALPESRQPHVRAENIVEAARLIAVDGDPEFPTGPDV